MDQHEAPPHHFEKNERIEKNGLTDKEAASQFQRDEGRIVMSGQETVADQILKVVRHVPGCQLDELEKSLPGLTWNQIFFEVDRLSRMEQVRVMPMGDGLYTVRLPLKKEQP